MLGEIEKYCDTSNGKCRCLYEGPMVDFCGEKNIEISKKIDELNYCEIDEDCAYRGETCPLQDSIINKNADISSLENEIRQYWNDCSELHCEQIAHFPLECQEGKCVQIIEDCLHWGEEIPDDKEHIDTKCCEGFKKILKQSPCEPGSDACMENGCPIPEPRIIYGGICAPCGNGKCDEGYGENKCNCEEDCSGVAIKTDKEEYKQGEEINATLEYSSKIYSQLYWSVQEWKDGSWESVVTLGWLLNTPDCSDINIDSIDECIPWIYPERPIWFEVIGEQAYPWNQILKTGENPFQCQATSGEIEERNCAVMDLAEPGKYKIRFEYVTEYNRDDPMDRDIGIQYAEKEFTILPAVTITTDKKYYMQGETVKFENRGLVYRELSIWPVVYKKQGGDWEQFSSYCGSLGCSAIEDRNAEIECIELAELMPVGYLDGCAEMGKDGPWEWGQGYCETEPVECINSGGEKEEWGCSVDYDAGPGTYKMEFDYFLDENCEGEQLKAASNEFGIILDLPD